MNATNDTPCVPTMEPREFSTDFGQCKMARDLYQEYILQNSFFLRNEWLVAISFGLALPVVLAVAMESLKGLSFAIVYAIVHVIVAPKIVVAIKQKFCKEYPKEASYIFVE